MSGDVQPRKRKDKRRKKEDEEYTIRRIRSSSVDDEDGDPVPQLVHPTEHASSENFTLHVHKEGGTGGHWCAKVIFFALLAALVGILGIILIEHRGTTDVEIPLSASKWASMLEGWIDDSPPSHDHDEEESQEIEGEENDEHDGEGSEGEENDGEESEGEPDESDEPNSDGEELDEGIDEGAESQDEEDLEGNESEPDEGENDEYTNEDIEDQEFLEEDEQDPLEEYENDLDNEQSEPEDEDSMNNEEYVDIPGITMDDNAEPLEEMEDNEGEDDLSDMDEGFDEEEEKTPPEDEQTTGVAVKFGVGVALVVAAHFVLVRRWNNAGLESSSERQSMDLTRRDTIVPPPQQKAKQVTQAIKNNEPPSKAKERQQNIIDDLRPSYDKLETEKPKVIAKQPVASQQSQVTREDPKQLKGKQQQDPSSEEEELSGSDLEDEEDLGSEELEEEIEEIDDGPLMQKLEAKYGKLPNESPEEDDWEEEDSAEQENSDGEELSEEAEYSDEDQDLEGWKPGVKAPSELRSGSMSGASSQQPKGPPVPGEKKPSNTGGARSIDADDESSHMFDDFLQDDINPRLVVEGGD